MLINQAQEFNNLSFEEIKELAQNCQRCALAKKRTRVVFGEGPKKCDLMLIGEGPGADEDISGRPFVGKAGQLLTKILEAAGIKRPEEIYITNVVKCRPPNNRIPLPEEIEQCFPYLLSQIKNISPKIILLAGASSTQAVLKTKEGISKIRGRWFKLENEIYVMPIFHPSFLLRNPSKETGSPRWLVWQDMQEVETALKYFKILKENQNEN